MGPFSLLFDHSTYALQVTEPDLVQPLCCTFDTVWLCKRPCVCADEDGCGLDSRSELDMCYLLACMGELPFGMFE
jgi:hypothetical protein